MKKEKEKRRGGERSERKRALNVGKTYALQQNTCFKKCVTSPSSSLSRGEQESIANSVDRFNESFDFVTSTFLSVQQGGR